MLLNDYSILLDFRDKLFPHFRKHQHATAEEIFKRIKCHVESDNLKWIVDLGCGTGEILRKLSESFSSQYADKVIHYIGVDSCQDEIKCANRGKHSCTFICADAVEHLCKLHDIDWNKALLLCIGHTIPHFEDQDGFLNSIKELRPAFLIADFYHDWDAVVTRLKENPGEEVNEPRGELKRNQDVYVLTTRGCDGASDRVLRGIQIFRENHFIEKFWTRQVLQPRSWFTSRFASIDYIPKLELDYHSGYGEMHSILFLRQCPKAKTVNNVYAEILSRRLKVISALSHIKNAMGLFGARMAAAILPFDKNHTFAKYVSIVPEADADAEKCRLMYLDEPSNIQDQLPTAFGLYMTLLNEVGASTVIPLAKLPNAAVCKVDEMFYQNEEGPFFKASGWQDPDDTKTIGSLSQARESFFVVPFYFADLPLFCLVLDFYGRLPLHTTDSSVYVSLLRNISQLFKNELVATFKEDVLRPFMERAVHELYTAHGRKPHEAIVDLQDMMKYVSGKPWKSWLLTLPSEEIRDLEIVKSERTVLDQMWKDVAKLVLSDSLGRISVWFQTGTFFEDSHESLDVNEDNDKNHIKKLHQMLKVAGISTLNELPKATSCENCKETRWAIKQLQIIQDSNADYDQRDDAYQKLKYVFCREDVNKGERYRFHLNRIACLCEMGLPQITLDSATKRIHGRVVLKDDKTLGLVTFITELESVGGIAKINFMEQRTIKAERTHEMDARFDFTIVVVMKTPFVPGDGKGNFSAKIKDALEPFDLLLPQSFKCLKIRFALDAKLRTNKTMISADWAVCDGKCITLESEL